ncbi:MAG: thrombospondin type 3 repeat-containing protein [Saprospiraceae bacterium]|nr:thrombospondin type 3 repeat-containing protein [Saprospiraceae bacterium]
MDDGSWDTCGPLFFDTDVTTFDCGDLGDNVVLMSVSDGSGNVNNSNACSGVVTVIDTLAPVVLSCPLDTMIPLPNGGNCEIQVIYNLPEATDNCGVSEIVLAGGSGSGNFFPIGIHTETYVITDVAGNTSICTFVIEVFSDQSDSDGDSVPNSCDQCPDEDDLLDTDSDGIPDCLDPCPFDPDMTDTDGDEIHDVCDNCPDEANSNQKDKDGDGVGDACDMCDGEDDTIDTDGDGFPDCADPCPFNADTTDTDGDGIHDVCDNCPLVANDKQKDKDGDGIGDACDPDPLIIFPGSEVGDADVANVYPNPTTDIVRIRFEESIEGKATVRIYNGMGVLIVAKQYDVINAFETIELSLRKEQCTPGVYLVHGATQTQHFVHTVILMDR